MSRANGLPVGIGGGGSSEKKQCQQPVEIAKQDVYERGRSFVLPSVSCRALRSLSHDGPDVLPGGFQTLAAYHDLHRYRA